MLIGRKEWEKKLPTRSNANRPADNRSELERHIDTMSRLREGIYLRSYANTNPLQDYVNEGHALFRDMLDKVSADVCLKLLNAIIQIKKPEETSVPDDKVIDTPAEPVREKE
jgi:preprotein translocase subunit SecA